MKKAIAMKCSQEDWDSIKDLIPKKINAIIWGGFENNNYLTNNWGEQLQIGNHSKWHSCFDRCEIHETFNAKIFLEACGIELEKKFEITKEQILELSNHTFLAERWFPEAFKTEFIIGKWYKVTNIANGSLGFDGIGQYTLDKNDSGLLDHQDGFNFKQADGRIWRTNGDISEATKQEAEAALVKEAKKIGFKDGIYVKSTSSVIGLVNCGIFVYCNIYNKLYYGGYEIFDKGKWATIIETISKEEAEKILNKKIV